MLWGVLPSITLFVCFLLYIYKRCNGRESYTEIPTTSPPQISSINSNSPLFSAMTPSSSPNVLFHTTSESQPSPTFPLMPLEIVTLEDEEEPVSSRTRSHTSTCRKKLNFAEVSLWMSFDVIFICYVMLVMSQTVSLVWHFS